MTQFRISQKLTRCGISPKMQGLIFFTCLNAKELGEETEHKILNLCMGVANEDYQALYRFLTDGYINHDFICREYCIYKEKLFEYKQRFYVEYAKYIKTV